MITGNNMNNNVFFNKMSQFEIDEKIKEFIICSNFKVKQNNIDEMQFIYHIEDVARKIRVHFLCKNITSSGWSDKPDIVRIQIKNISDVFFYTNKNKTFLLSGICLYRDKWILIVWNAYRYMNHKTNRSCYVNMSTLEQCYNDGYTFSKEFNQETWLCDVDNFKLLIRDYIMFTYSGE